MKLAGPPKYRPMPPGTRPARGLQPGFGCARRVRILQATRAQAPRLDDASESRPVRQTERI